MKKKTLIKIVLFIIYIVALSYLLFVAESMGRSDVHFGVNLVPFAEIRRYITRISTIGVMYVGINLLGNIIVMIPFGYALPSLFGAGRKRPILYVFVGMLFSILIEFSQYLTHTGTCDVDDVILNTVGVILGYLLYSVSHRKAKVKS
jgi:glycopeptide antibiotics resistance protein